MSQTGNYKPNILFESIRTLPANRFIDCDCGPDRTPLVMTGEFTPEQLEEHWANVILPEYLDAKASEGDTDRTSQAAEAEALALQILRVEALIEALRKCYDERLGEELRAEGFDYTYSEETLEEDLRLTEVELRGSQYAMRLSFLKKRVQGEEVRPTKRTYENYADVINALSAHHKYRINTREITTLEFCRLQKELSDHYNRQLARQDGQSED